MIDPNDESAQSLDGIESATGTTEDAAAGTETLDQPLEAFHPNNQPAGPHGQLLSSTE